MVKGPFGGKRPFASPTVKLTIKEIPIPHGQSDRVFPEPVIRTTDTERAIIENIADITTLSQDEIAVDRSSKFRRGLGQTTTYTIHLNVGKQSTRAIGSILDQLDDEGYKFSSEFLE